MTAKTGVLTNVYKCRRCWAELSLTGDEVEEVVVNEGELRCVDGDCPDKRDPKMFEPKETP